MVIVLLFSRVLLPVATHAGIERCVNVWSFSVRWFPFSALWGSDSPPPFVLNIAVDERVRASMLCRHCAHAFVDDREIRLTNPGGELAYEVILLIVF